MNPEGLISQGALIGTIASSTSPELRKLALLEQRLGSGNHALKNNIQIVLPVVSENKVDVGKENILTPSTLDRKVQSESENETKSEDLPPPLTDKNFYRQEPVEHVNWMKEYSNGGTDNSKSNLKRKGEIEIPTKSPKKVVHLEDSSSNQDSGSKGIGAITTGTVNLPANMLPLHHYFSSSSIAPSSTGDLPELKSITKPSVLIAKPSNGIVKGNNTTNSSINNNTSTSAGSSTDWKKQIETLKAAKESAEGKLSRVERDLKDHSEKNVTLENRNTKLCRTLEEVTRNMAMQEIRRRRDRIALDCVRLGKLVPKRVGPTAFQEVWEEGYALNELNQRRDQLAIRKEELEARRKRLQGLKRGARKGAGGLVSNSDDLLEYEMDVDLSAETEAIRVHLEQLKKDELALGEERRLLESEKAAHQKELKRCYNEDQSRFQKDLPFLNNRYLLLSLLGKGGFSEVWKALDMAELKEVALKVHQLNSMWTEERKQSYIKHVTREYKIHRDLRHPRVVQFYDVFEIDVNSFATVLEYCKGTDLDERLKREKVILEKEAKFVLLQMISALRYLNSPSTAQSPDYLMNPPRVNEQDPLDDSERASLNGGLQGKRRAIIHFDLKPGNILFDEFGDVKVTDFGLSKIMEENNDNTSLELTSQGAGTYWYLPPECFHTGTGPDTPRISTKVDIWSLGVIFYQMLFGRKPFGEGKTQDKVLAEGTILQAYQVDFPAVPKVSDEAKDFIRICLTHDQKYRPDVYQLCQHTYVRKGEKMKN